MNAEIGKNVKSLRAIQKLSQQQLAEKVGYTDKSAISLIESGKLDIPYSKIIALADALHTTPSYLMGCHEEDEEIISAEDRALLAAYHRSGDGIQEAVRVLLGLKGERRLSASKEA